MRVTCWIPKATQTHTHNMQYLLFFNSNNGCTNAPQCYVIRTLPVWLPLPQELPLVVFTPFPAVPYGQTDMMKLIVAFRNLAKAPTIFLPIYHYWTVVKARWDVTFKAYMRGTCCTDTH